MNIDTICILIPTHPPHYHYIYALLNKLKEHTIQIDIFLVFSSNTHFNAFNMKEYIHPIIIQEPIETKSIITFKKFYGLNQLISSKYDYIICCDSEIDIIPEHFTQDTITKKIEEIFINKKIYGGLTEYELPYDILRTCIDLFPTHIEYFRTITADYRLYFWFSDLPVYRKSDLSTFFDTIQYTIKNDLVYNQFDYMIYQLFLILTDGFEIINTTPITNLKWSLEYMLTEDKSVLHALLDIGYGFSWNTKAFYTKNQSFVHEQKGFLVYHLDRPHLRL